MPQFKNNNMITASASTLLILEIGDNFGFPKINGNKVSGNYTTMAFNVQRISKKQLLKLAELVKDTETDVEFKRSGTGITVNFK